MKAPSRRQINGWRRSIADDALQPQRALGAMSDGTVAVKLRAFVMKPIKPLSRTETQVPTYGAFKVPVLRSDEDLWNVFKRDLCSFAVPRRRYSSQKRRETR